MCVLNTQCVCMRSPYILNVSPVVCSELKPLLQVHCYITARPLHGWQWVKPDLSSICGDTGDLLKFAEARVLPPFVSRCPWPASLECILPTEPLEEGEVGNPKLSTPWKSMLSKTLRLLSCKQASEVRELEICWDTFGNFEKNITKELYLTSERTLVDLRKNLIYTYMYI